MDKPSKEQLKNTKSKQFKNIIRKRLKKLFAYGYRNRTVISELLAMNDDLKTAIEENATEKEITEIALKNNFKPFIFDAVEKLKME